VPKHRREVLANNSIDFVIQRPCTKRISRKGQGAREDPFMVCVCVLTSATTPSCGLRTMDEAPASILKKRANKR